jgi:amidase
MNIGKLTWQQTFEELKRRLELNETTSVNLVEQALKDIEAHASYNAIGVVSPVALTHAKQLDDERALGQLRSPLHGIPIVIKDNLMYRDGTPTTANSYALRNLMPRRNAVLVDRLLKAGVIIVGKANMSEMANFLTEGLPNGYGSMYGQVKHPYDESVDPLGSSTGSAVAVALKLVAGAIGTETNGSLIAPAFYNQVVTLKPTQGLLPQDGIIPISPSQDTAGPMTNTVKDAALLMDVLTDQKGAFTDALEQPMSGVVAVLTMKGWLGEFLPEAWVETIKEDLIVRLQSMGLGIEMIEVTPEDIPNHLIMLAEYKHALDAFFKTVPDFHIQSTEDLIAEYQRHPERAMKYGISLLEASLDHAKASDDPEYLALKADQQAKSSYVQDLLEKEGYRAVITFGWTDYGAIYGNPSVHVPEKTWKTHPRGVTFLGKKGSDADLLALAHQYEQQILE